MLRTQYRCHPYISALPNHLFYGGCLRDGISAEERPPLIPGWPTLAFLDVPAGQERSSGSGSFYNEAEISLLMGLLETLVAFGVDCAELGVITLYKAQLGKMAQRLQEKRCDAGVNDRQVNGLVEDCGIFSALRYLLIKQDQSIVKIVDGPVERAHCPYQLL